MAKQTYGSERQWYAIHTYSGYEDAVARNLRQRVESFGVQDKIFNVVVPTEKKNKRWPQDRSARENISRLRLGGNDSDRRCMERRSKYATGYGLRRHSESGCSA